MKTKLPAAIATKEEAIAFLSELQANREEFHPEDDATDLVEDTFTFEEGTQLNKLMSDIYALEGNNYPNDMAFDPCAFLIDNALLGTRFSQDIEETFPTIQEAFKHGKGDVFFCKDDQYICLSRHVNNDARMQQAGFKRLTYKEVIALSHSDNTVDSAAVWTAAVKKAEPEFNAPAPVKKTFVHYGSDRSYYDDYPDAYGQNL